MIARLTNMYKWHWIDETYLANLVVKNDITAEEYQLITNEPYVAA